MMTAHAVKHTSMLLLMASVVYCGTLDDLRENNKINLLSGFPVQFYSSQPIIFVEERSTYFSDVISCLSACTLSSTCNSVAFKSNEIANNCQLMKVNARSILEFKMNLDYSQEVDSYYFLKMPTADDVKVNGGWSPWETLHCSKTCGEGAIYRQRSCNNPEAANGGQYCVGDNQELVEACNIESCPVNGGWSQWTLGGPCSVTCGSGFRSYQRVCDSPSPVFGGKDCGTEFEKTENCDSGPCPVDGGWSSWEIASGCTVTCGGGEKVFNRSCTNPAPVASGLPCPGEDSRKEICADNVFCPINGGWSEWELIPICSVTCGSGTAQHVRYCNSPPPSNGGLDCPGENLSTASCMVPPCSVDGGWTSWGSPSLCTATCDGGQQTLTRTCTNPTPVGSGSSCSGDDSKTQVCAEDVICPTGSIVIDDRGGDFMTVSSRCTLYDVDASDLSFFPAPMPAGKMVGWYWVSCSNPEVNECSCAPTMKTMMYYPADGADRVVCNVISFNAVGAICQP